MTEVAWQQVQYQRIRMISNVQQNLKSKHHKIINVLIINNLVAMTAQVTTNKKRNKMLEIEMAVKVEWVKMILTSVLSKRWQHRKNKNINKINNLQMSRKVKSPMTSWRIKSKENDKLQLIKLMVMIIVLGKCYIHNQKNSIMHWHHQLH